MAIPKIQSMRLVLEVTTGEGLKYEGATRPISLRIVDYEDYRVFKMLDAAAKAHVAARHPASLAFNSPSDDTELDSVDMVLALYARMEKLPIPTNEQLLSWDMNADGSPPATMLELLRNRLLSNVAMQRTTVDHEGLQNREANTKYGLRYHTAFDQAGDSEALRNG